MNPQPRIISGRVVDSEMKPIENARVLFTAGPVPLQDIAALTTDDGRFAVAAPVPGKYQIQFVADNFKTRFLEVNIDGGQRPDLEVLLERV